MTRWDGIQRLLLVLLALLLASCSLLPNSAAVSDAPAPTPLTITSTPAAFDLTAAPTALRKTSTPVILGDIFGTATKQRATTIPSATRQHATVSASATARTRTTPQASPTSDAPSAQAIPGFKTVTPGELPPEARHTLDLIVQGGPFPYRQDGVVFQNREQHLPRHASGYYHEYTVTTPGAGNRGTRRIITGSTGEYFYTDDHYNSFVQVLLP